MDFCRVITFINYHILFADEQWEECDDIYVTTGFFDGMFTERIEVDYKNEGLKKLWYYTLNCIGQGNGQYSHQNTFCFGNDEKNCCSDEEFWDDEVTNNKYPLTFVTFLQLRQYLEGNDGLDKQCQIYAGILAGLLKTDGIAYVYTTVDKNDLVVCIKSRNYTETVKMIRQLHDWQEIVYSHSIFSVSNKILRYIREEKFDFLEKDTLDSICLKGVTNSYEPKYHFRLDQKYRQFCEKLICKIYGVAKIEDAQQFDYEIYDILGDDDFRLIARKVDLRKLLIQLGPGGLFSFVNPEYRYYLFTSSLILNTKTEMHDEIQIGEQKDSYAKMLSDLKSPHCDYLETCMPGIQDVISGKMDATNAKVLTYCHAVWQLLQSLKALEAAPGKKYDFFSLYEPFRVLVHILEEKVSGSESALIAGEKKEVFEFIHKISMTLHGTQRTDIQFFQIKDFNAIVHYAPAKLRAFYSLLILKISDFYNEFCNEERNQYSFIFSPGMFSRTSVQELFEKYDENKRVMLITLPERQLYEPKNLAILLAHEAAHFVGYVLRNRQQRHESWINCCVRILDIEMKSFVYSILSEEVKRHLEQWDQTDIFFYDKLLGFINSEETLYRKKNNMYPHEFHSRNSAKVIKEAFKKVEQKKEFSKLTEDLAGKQIYFLQKKLFNTTSIEGRNLELIKETLKLNGLSEQYRRFYSLFENAALESLLKLLRYVYTEAYADIIAILTLDIMPEEYIDSFFSNELSEEIMQQQGEIDYILPFRWALVTLTIEEALKRHKKFFAKNYMEFYDKWNGSVLEEVRKKYSKKSAQAESLLYAVALLREERYVSGKIENYRPLYNDLKREFCNKKYDFFNDRIVRKSILTYLTGCVDIYVYQLKGSQVLQKMKNDLSCVYKNISGNSINIFVQQIENSLDQYEKEYAWDNRPGS